MEKYLCIGVMFMLSFPLFSQILTITDQETGLAIELVLIQSNKPDAFTMTDAQGQADISTFIGADKIEIRMIGYRTEIKSFAELHGSDFRLQLYQFGVSLEQVVVAASKWSQAKSEIPSRISTISPRQIAMSNPQTTADVLGFSGEVFIQKSQLGGGSPMIRGFSTNRLLISVDGIRMNNAIFRSGNLQNIISLDPLTIQNAELVFGPGSAIYGSDAIGGVMSFQTLQPEFSHSANVQIKGNTMLRHSTANKEKSTHLDFNIGLNKWAFISSFSLSDYGNLRMGKYGPDEYLRTFYTNHLNGQDVVIENPNPLIQHPTEFSQWSIMQKVRFQPNDDIDLNYGFHYSTTSKYSRYDRHIRLRDRLPRSGDWYYGPQQWLLSNLSVTNKRLTKIYDEFAIRFAYQNFQESRHDRDLNSLILRERFENVDALSLNADFKKEFNSIHHLYYGFESVYNKVNSYGTDRNIEFISEVEGPPRYPNATWQSYAVYLNYHFKLSENVLFQSSGRYNHFLLDANFDNQFYSFPFSSAKLNQGAFTGSAGMVFHPNRKLTLSANLATGFRAPNVDDIGKVFDSEPGSVVVPNPALKPEYATNFDLGIAKVLGDFIKLDYTMYYTSLKNAMTRRDFSLNGQDSIIYAGELSQVEAIQNVASAYVFGIQAGIEVKLPSGFSFSSRYNFQQGKEELDDGSSSPLRHAAPTFGSTHISYSTSKYKIDLNAIYNTEKSFVDLPEGEKGKSYLYASDLNGNPYSPSWYTLNLKAIYNPSEFISFSTGLENILDKRYRMYSSGIAAPGRNLIVSVKLSF